MKVKNALSCINHSNICYYDYKDTCLSTLNVEHPMFNESIFVCDLNNNFTKYIKRRYKDNEELTTSVNCVLEIDNNEQFNNDYVKVKNSFIVSFLICIGVIKV